MPNQIPQAVQWYDENGKYFSSPGADAAVPGHLDILDQTRLPGEVIRRRLAGAQEIYDAIFRLEVRGAPAIGCAAALGLAACAQRFTADDPDQWQEELKKCAAFLDSSRPTAVNLHWALERCLAAAGSCSGGIREKRQTLLDEALSILAEDARMCADIGKHGMTLLRDGCGILTHCNAGALATGGCGTALAPIYAAHAAGMKLKVFSDETRPLLQGARLTAWELAVSGIDVTTICDSMAAQVMREGKVQIVIVGADRVAANGDTANKIGTYQLAITARYHNVPFYIAMPYSTIDHSAPDGRAIPIEERSGDEIFHSPGASVYNPAFDVTPAELISGYITERGIFTRIDEL